MTLTTRLAVDLGADLSSALDLGGASAPLDIRKIITLASGTATGQADKVWHDRRTIAASGTDDIDLAGSLTDALGVTVTFARIKMMVVIADPDNTNNVIVGAAAANPFINWVGGATHTVTVRPGGLLVLAASDAGYAVTAGTGDILRVANSGAGTGVDYDIALIGASA